MFKVLLVVGFHLLFCQLVLLNVLHAQWQVLDLATCIQNMLSQNAIYCQHAFKVDFLLCARMFILGSGLHELEVWLGACEMW